MIRFTLLALSALPAFAQSLDGNWRGTLEAGGAKLRLALEITKTGDGFTGVLDSIDQGSKIPIDRIQVNGDSVRLELDAVKGTYEGTMDAGRTKMKGTWTQGQPLPLEFVRAEPDAPKPVPVVRDSGFGLPVELRVPIEPTPVVGNGKTHLVYELHITNFAGEDLLWKRFEILGDGKPIASFEGGVLSFMLTKPGKSGQITIAFLWATLEGAPPAVLRHRLTAGEVTIEGAEVAVVSSKPVVLGPPLRGANWMALNGPGNSSIHRRALLPLSGKATIAQRFAIDWLRLGADGKNFSGDAKVNRSYSAWGAEAIAVADATVAGVKDGIPENVPGLRSRAVPITLDTLVGNFVLLDLGQGRHALYAHLQPGSLRVKPGDRVKRGQVLGLVGNSGNSTEPHLHFHLTNGVSPLTSEGVPYVFDSFEAAGQPRTNEIPMQNARVRFP